MRYTTQDVSDLIEDVKGHDDVIGHCSPQNGCFNISVRFEDSGSTLHEDR